jgi:hypothetical protein
LDDPKSIASQAQRANEMDKLGELSGARQTAAFHFGPKRVKDDSLRKEAQVHRGHRFLTWCDGNAIFLIFAARVR